MRGMLLEQEFMDFFSTEIKWMNWIRRLFWQLETLPGIALMK
ncbi:hypothetical protein C5167_017003 [Papaver somniferum]|uniref:Uncharacterized protein n=1 Tax=Papaver somniferum TaxID=3469 RepID=A0A4Y7II63_PAPSO|nr:hypothetical protein C5167_017003 [Papaver somniferum]